MWYFVVMGSVLLFLAVALVVLLVAPAPKNKRPKNGEYNATPRVHYFDEERRKV